MLVLVLVLLLLRDGMVLLNLLNLLQINLPFLITCTRNSTVSTSTLRRPPIRFLRVRFNLNLNLALNLALLDGSVLPLPLINLLHPTLHSRGRLQTKRTKRVRMHMLMHTLMELKTVFFLLLLLAPRQARAK